MGAAPFVTVARAVKPHGLAGEIAFDPRLEDDLKWLEGVTVWFVPPAEQAIGYRVNAVRTGPKGPLVAIDSVDSPEQARSLAGRAVLVRETDAPEGYLVEEPDMCGVSVTDSDRGFIGEITDVIVTGANDVWVVRGDRFGEVLIPVIDDVVLDLDMQERRAVVRLLPGLIDGEESS
ncbi:MAG: ribosome maturation factor RimM [Coriobacteriia bacterium]|nr:ribosome maturation factor RimM [Coriobacteriia bacterium]